VTGSLQGELKEENGRKNHLLNQWRIERKKGKHKTKKLSEKRQQRMKIK
jgi:hypothetical protein